MKVLVQEGQIGLPDTLRRFDAVVEGVRKIGMEPVVWKGKHTPLGGVRFGIIRGMRRSSELMREAMTAVGIPWLVSDLGYLKRTKYADVMGDGYYYQLGWHHIGWTPGFDVPGDRFERLGIPAAVERPNVNRNEVLIAGQMAMDAQHNLSAMALCHWLTTAWERQLPTLPSSCVPVYRPHPRDTTGIKPSISGIRVDRGDGSKALERARMVITYNSTFGVEAMLQAVPVVCVKQAHYREHCNLPYEGRLAYLHKLAYAQWTLDEFRDGTALGFLLGCIPD